MTKPSRGPPPTATLFAQILALVLLSLTIAQAINVWVIFHLPRPSPDYYLGPEISQAMKRGPTPPGPAADMRALVVSLSAGPPSGETDPGAYRRLRKDIGTRLQVDPEAIVITSPEHTDRQQIRVVRRRLELSGRDRDAPFVLAPFELSVRQPSGQWMTARSPRPAFPSAWQTRIILWLLITAVAMAPVAWLFARRLSSSVALFAEAAERLGRDPNAPPLPVRGPTEISRAILTFNEMQERLRRYVVDRTAMAAAMAHDLRTPLTRLRFRVEAAPTEVQAKMISDIEEMEAMISASLAYVRDARGAAEHTPLELSSLLDSVVDDMADTGKAATVERCERLVISGDPMGLRRLLTNLVENACKFGGSCRTRVFAEDGCAVIQVEDDGPGVPEGDLEKVFEPFYRGEPSRSRETGGSGLGLAAVRSIARAHGGDAILRNRPAPDKGLIAEVKLPL